MAIPPGLLVHVAAVTPLAADGSFGAAFDLPCYFEQRVFTRQRDPEGVPAAAEAMLYADLATDATDVPNGSRLTVNGYGAEVLQVEHFDDGGVTGLAHREFALRIWRLS